MAKKKETSPLYMNNARLTSIVSEPTTIQAEKIVNAETLNQVFHEVWPEDLFTRECFMAMYLNRLNVPLAVQLVSMGGVASTIVDPKLVFAPAFRISGVTALILAHNHPSGNVRPSPSDLDLTKQIQKGANFLEFTLVDHIILTPDKNKYFSFAEEGLL